MSINFQELRELLSAIAQTDITELTLKNDEFELTVRKEVGWVAPQVTAATSELVTNPVNLPVTPPVVQPTPPTPEANASTAPDDKKWVNITSPMVGTFYRAPAPDEEPFVNVGDRITKGDTVCIIEAMKLMNEIEGEITGQIMEISVQNGEPVEFGQVLMRINPD
ncbi:MAG: acetyl-CoA carboxylase biotin carboxyl carrier protein [Pleurocapsa sp.]